MASNALHRPAQVSYHAAHAALAAGLAECGRIGMNSAIVVTDPSGEMIAVARTDGASGNTYRGALGKAKTAAVLGCSTEEYLERRLLVDEVLYRALTADDETFLVPVDLRSSSTARWSVASASAAACMPTTPRSHGRRWNASRRSSPRANDVSTD